MKCKRIVILLTAVCALSALCACTVASVAPDFLVKGEAEELETVIRDIAEDKQMQSEATYSFASVTQMKKTVPARNMVSVLLKGYFYANDGGGGMFYWDSESTAEPDDGLVVCPNDTEVGRYIRVCDNDYRNVKWFGAVGSGSSNDTSAVQRAVASLPASGGTVFFPGGTYCIGETIQIGNGDGESARSDINGIKLVGLGGGFGVYGGKEPTQILATRPMDTMISINGRIADVTLEGLNINAGSTAKRCVSAKAVNSFVITDCVLKMFTECGLYMVGGTGNGNGNSGCRFESVSAISTTDGITCVYIDGDESTCATENCMFIDCRFDIHTTNDSKAMWIKKADGLQFYRCHFAGYNDASDYLVLDASADGYPYGNTFYDCSVKNLRVIENDGHSIGHSFFYGYGTYDLETVPDHPMLHGITDSGLPFQLGGE